MPNDPQKNPQDYKKLFDVLNNIIKDKKHYLKTARLNAILQRRELQKLMNKGEKFSGEIMGRRETLSERQRRNKRIKDRRLEATETEKGYHFVELPSWFTTTSENIDVSIIVPLYLSQNVIEKQIEGWDLKSTSLNTEIIYVDDNCPNKSKDQILKSWTKRKVELHNRGVGKVIESFTNRGYGGACNLGAKFAKGKYLIFLNADVYVKPNWIQPLYDTYTQDDRVGIVGNLQTHGSLVDSCGSEFVWSGNYFPHIGRDIFKGKSLSSPITLNQMPEELKQVGERDMVTGCCFMISKSLFEEIEGYDEVYKIGYWEDTDMNMRVKSLGYKVLFQPNSSVEHVGGHSRAGGHKHSANNRHTFKTRWIESGRIDALVSAKRPIHTVQPKTLRNHVNGDVVGCIIACNEEEFIAPAIESISPLTKRFIAVVGGNHYAYASGMCDKNGYPNDNTLEILRELSKTYDIEIIEPPGRLWNNKTEMRNAYAEKLIPDNWMFMLDGDEVYKESQLWQLTSLMKTYDILHMNYHLFWNNMETIGTGSWEGYPQERMVKWRKGYSYKDRTHFSVASPDGGHASSKVKTYTGNDKLFYHYAWVRPLEKIQQKVNYYQHQLAKEWNDPKGVHSNYMQDVFLKWRHDPSSVKATHPRGGGSTTPFAGIHPASITKLLNAGKLNF